jgi:glycosyltransferase involved in cell wall biosynthesis
MLDGISTIMPIYLGALGPSAVSNLLRAADSVLSQDCEIPLELLIVDDGSMPAVESVPELEPLLADTRVRTLRLIQNQGLTYAENAGLTQARYDLIARMDGDDFWRPGKLRQQIELFASDPDLTLVGTSMRLVHPHDHSLDRDELRGGSWNEVLEIFKRVGCPFPHGSILARKEVFEILGGYPHAAANSHCDDFALWGSWVRFFKVAILNEVLFEYTVSDHQISARFAEQQRRASAIVRQAFLDLGDYSRIPHAIDALAARMGVPVYSASRILCTAWMYYDEILVDADLYEAARIVFPDRAVHRFEDAPWGFGDRFCYLHRGAFDGSRSSHARIVHTVEDCARRIAEESEAVRQVRGLRP